MFFEYVHQAAVDVDDGDRETHGNQILDDGCA